MKLLKIILPCLLLGACMFGRSKSPTYYTYFPMATTAVSADYTAAVGVDRVQLPKYMDRPQIVTQQPNSPQVNISEFNRWAEHPSLLAARALTDNLSVLLPAAQVKLNKSNAEPFDRVISVEVVRLDAVLGQQAQLVAWYTVKNTDRKTLLQQKFSATVQIGKTYEDLVKGYNELLAQLSTEIAGKLVH